MKPQYKIKITYGKYRGYVVTVYQKWTFLWVFTMWDMVISKKTETVFKTAVLAHKWSTLYDTELIEDYTHD